MGLWQKLDAMRSGPAGPHGVIAVEPLILVDVKFFGRHKGGAIRDGVLLSLRDRDSATPKSGD
jgi:hypothetical protein